MSASSFLGSEKPSSQVFMRLVCGVGPLTMGPGSGSFPNRAKDKECRGQRMGIHKQGDVGAAGTQLRRGLCTDHGI